MRNLGTILRNITRMATGPLRERGLIETVRSVRGWRAAARHEREDRFDERFGTDTERTFSAADLEASGDDVVKLWRYAPTTEASFANVIRDAGVDPRSFVFVDLGSGKGRVLLLASHYPFRRIEGVEISPSLHEAALRNIDLYRPVGQRCRDFRLHCRDAATWVPPTDTNLLVYLFQPFPNDVLNKVLANLEASVAGTSRTLVIAYLNPIFDDVVRASGRLTRVRDVPRNERGEFGWAIYTNRPNTTPSLTETP